MKVTAPSSLNDITLKQYQQFRKLEDPSAADVVKIFLNLPIEIVNKIPKTQVDTISREIIEMFNEDCPMINVFELNGKKFGFVPTLNEMSYGEYTDATSYMNSEESVNLHKCMAVLYRPVILHKKGKYLIEDYEGSSKYCDELLDMPVSIAMGCMVFHFLQSA